VKTAAIGERWGVKSRRANGLLMVLLGKVGVSLGDSFRWHQRQSVTGCPQDRYCLTCLDVPLWTFSPIPSPKLCLRHDKGSITARHACGLNSGGGPASIGGTGQVGATASTSCNNCRSSATVGGN
jgi:hypothetical protein